MSLGAYLLLLLLLARLVCLGCHRPKGLKGPSARAMGIPGRAKNITSQGLGTEFLEAVLQLVHSGRAQGHLEPLRQREFRCPYNTYYILKKLLIV